MALQFDGGLILPIGCSCITSFELRTTTLFPGALSDPHFFDWMIATPDSTCDLLGDLAPILRSPDDLELYGRRVRSRRFPGLYFWHILNEGTGVTLFDSLEPVQAQFSEVSGKYNYLIEKLRAVNQNTYCIWSNIQPNLKEAVEEEGMDWSDFILTEARYERLKHSVRHIAPGHDCKVFFVCRAEDVEAALIGREDVYILNMKRGLSGGLGPGSFAPVLARIAGLAGTGKSD